MSAQAHWWGKRHYRPTTPACGINERPQTIDIREVGRTVVQHKCAAIRERADDLPRTHDPTDIREPKQALTDAQISLERSFFGDLHREATVNVHRANLMQKLNLHSTAEIVLYAVRKGLIS